MRVIVDMKLCEGYGVCVLAAPTVFDIDEEDNLILLDERPPEVVRRSVTEAMSLCPKRAIGIAE